MAKGAHARIVAVPSQATARSARLTSAFTASAQLRPMAQQLAGNRSGAAFAGVMEYARLHPGEGASAAYLAAGHAYMLDRRFAEAGAAFRQAGVQGSALDDYAEYLGAQAALQSGNGSGAFGLLSGFAQRHPDSVFAANAPVLLANAYLQQNNAAMALQTLESAGTTAQAGHSDFLYAKGRALQLSGQAQQAAAIYREIYLKQPLTFEAGQAKTQLVMMGTQLTAAERKVHADQLFNAKRYSDAGVEYHALERDDASLSQADKNALEIYAAVCDLKLKHISRRDAEKLPDTSDDSAALKMYILAEVSRNEKDVQAQRNVVQEMLERFPHSRWTEEALYSAGNAYLLMHDSPNAIWHYTALFTNFPSSVYAPSAHWRAAWMNYRLRKYPEAARLMEEQVARYPQGTEASSALYWRGRLYEDPERNFAQAVNFYQTLSSVYRNYYYGEQARVRLRALGQQSSAAPAPVLSNVRTPETPTLVGALPENDPHLIKARLLANAALNEYIAPEIQMSETSAQWGTLAQAEIYASYGENVRALQAMKHSGLPFFSLPVAQVPMEYWHLLFPMPYWNDIQTQAQKNGVDPYLVASLIRQETEFNPGAVSRANAYGLMQLLPSVGKAEAKRQGMKGFNTNMLLNPSVNIQLGVANLKHVLDRFGGQPEYALAAYNAGDTPVRNWMAQNDYKDLPEYVESITYTETREYVQAVMRNREMYRQIYSGAK
jgi:soluble lytic murein transglycosylase